MAENIDEILTQLMLALVTNQKNLKEEHHNKFQKIPNSIYFHLTANGSRTKSKSTTKIAIRIIK